MENLNEGKKKKMSYMAELAEIDKQSAIVAMEAKINKLAEDSGIPVWVGGMLESALGASVCIALATLDNFTYPGDLFPSERFYENDLCKPENKFKSPYIFEPLDKLPAPDNNLLEEFTVKSKKVS